MRYILLPVKDLTHAKQRLANLLTQVERTQLAWAMLQNTFAAVAQVKHADGVAVVTLYPPAIELARQYGFMVIDERAQISESHSVDFGAQVLAERGVASVLRLPLDLPLVQPVDIETVLQHDDAPAPACVLVPSREGTGTNAILRRAPTLFASQFGADSLPKHLAAAARAKAQCKVLEIPRIALDLDDANDMRELLRQPDDNPLKALLAQLAVAQRLTQT